MPDDLVGESAQQCSFEEEADFKRPSYGGLEEWDILAKLSSDRGQTNSDTIIRYPTSIII
jgi:hypothetical protein